jgi:hypothetical protein
MRARRPTSRRRSRGRSKPPAESGAARSGEAFDLLLALVDAAGSEDVNDYMTFMQSAIESGRTPDEKLAWLRAVQLLRDTNAAEENACTFLLHHLSEMISVSEIDRNARLVELSARIDAIRHDHGLTEDEDWYVDQGPPEWQALNREWEAEFDRQWRSILRRVGEEQLARSVPIPDPAVDEAIEDGRLTLIPET